MKFAIYNTVTGQILQTIAVPSKEDALNELQDGFSLLEVDDKCDDSLHYVSGRALTPFPRKPSENCRWDWGSMEWVDESTLISLDDLKTIKKREIRMARGRAEFGTFIWDYSVFQCNTLSRNRITQYLQAALIAKLAGQPFEVEWKLADNSMRTLSLDDMLGVGQTLALHTQAVHAKANELNAKVNDAKKASDLDKIKWPEKL